MKSITFLILLALLASCKKDKTEEVIDVAETPFIYPNVVSIGDSLASNLNFTNLHPDAEYGSYNSTTYNDCDIDSDGIADFQFLVTSAYPFAGTWFNGCSIRIKTLTANAEISLGLPDIFYTDSAYQFPKVYLENDSLENQSDWGTGEICISSNGDEPNDGCYGPNCPNTFFGPWFGMNDQYVGVRLDGNRLGWIKLSFPSTDVNSGHTIIVQEYGVLN